MSKKLRKEFSSPKMPFMYCNPILGKPFKMTITGYIPMETKEFVSINFGIHGGARFPNLSLPFHLSIRWSEGQLVRNTYSAEKQGWENNQEMKLLCDNYLIQFSPSFVMVLSCNEKEVTCTLDGTLAFKYAHRQDPRKIHFVEMHGPIVADSITLDFESK